MVIPSKLGLCCRCPTDALSEPYRDADKQYTRDLCFIRHTFVLKAYGVFQSIVTCRALLFGNFYHSLILVLSQLTYPVLISQLQHHLSSPSQRASLTPSMPPMTTDMDEPQNPMRTGFLDLPYELRYKVYCYHSSPKTYKCQLRFCFSTGLRSSYKEPVSAYGYQHKSHTIVKANQ